MTSSLAPREGAKPGPKPASEDSSPFACGSRWCGKGGAGEEPLMSRIKTISFGVLDNALCLLLPVRYELSMYFPFLHSDRYFSCPAKEPPSFLTSIAPPSADC